MLVLDYSILILKIKSSLEYLKIFYSLNFKIYCLKIKSFENALKDNGSFLH